MKKFFDKLNPRERLLLCCVASVAAFGWLSFLTRGFARADSERSTLAARIKTAKTVVGMSGEISREQLLAEAQPMAKNGYGQYLIQLAGE